MAKPILEWEDIDDFHQRAKVPGGWLVKVHESVFHLTDMQQGEGWDWRVSMTFLPDPTHSWGEDND